MEIWWRDSDMGKPEYSENLSQRRFVNQKSQWTDPGPNPGFRGTKPVTNPFISSSKATDARTDYPSPSST